MGDSVDADKRAVRAAMRTIRRELSDRSERSALIWEQVQALPAVLAASKVLVFDDIVGEPHTASFVNWCRAQGKEVAAPEDDIDPSWPDVVIVPGLAFTSAGERVGQGGGWFDRFLSQTRNGCTTIGVCFRPQLLPAVPSADHDVAVDLVVTD